MENVKTIKTRQQLRRRQRALNNPGRIINYRLNVT
jgi:hypothetical protein